MTMDVPRWLKWCGVRALTCSSKRSFGGDVRLIRLYWKQHEFEWRWFTSNTHKTP
jgi:hypothetical protein